MDLKFYLSLFLRRLPYFLVMLALGSVIGFALATVLPPRYVAAARLLVESEQIPSALATSTVTTQASEQLEIIEQRIMTRANLLELANRLEIYKGVSGMSADDIVEDMRARVNIASTGGDGGRGPAQATLVNVSFDAKTPELATLVANEFVTLILQENVSIRTGVAGQTLDFFVQEVARLDKELGDRGASILEFKQANKEALPDSLDFRRSQQAAAQERVLQMERDEATLKDRRTRLVTLYETTGQVETVTETQTPEQKQLQGLRDQLSSLLAVLSPTNPRVKILQTQIASLEKVVTAQAAGNSASAAGSGLSAYEVQLADLDGQLSFIKDEKAQISTQMEELRQTIEATPRNAIALDTLERDYANVRAQYDQAVANKAQAETGDLIETLAKGQRISVIEQAVAPREPASPNRPLIAAGGVGLGAGLGLGLVLLLEMMNRAIRRPIELTNKLGITPFASLPYIRTADEGRKRRSLIGVALALVLLGIPAVLWAVNTYYMPLDLLMDRVITRLGLGSFLGAGAGQ